MPKKEPDLSEFLTTREVAQKYDVLQHEVQRAIRKGLIQAQQVGYFYLIWGPGLPPRFPSSDAS